MAYQANPYLQQYNNSKILTASTAELTLMLYEGAIKFTNIAILAIEKKEIENDKYKEDLAFQNGVLKENFIRIDCFYSDYDYIKQNIINSPLYNLLELESFDWETCFKDAATSKLLIICDLWNSGERSFKVLNKKTGLSSSGIRSYLKRGTEIGLCSYEALGVCKKVRCKNDGTIFKSISEATRFYNLTSGHISDVCNGKRNFAGKHPITNQPLLWEYV